MTAAEFETELTVSGFRIVGNKIVCEDCPGIAWKPVKTGRQIDWASTLRKVIRERRKVILRQSRIAIA